MLKRLTLLTLFLFLLVPLLVSQKRNPAGPGTSPSIPGGLARPNTRDLRVEVQVTDDRSKPLNIPQLLVELSSFAGGTQRTYTNTDGRASFTVRGSATFQVTVSGQDIEPVTNTFELYPDEVSHRESVTIKFKQSAGNRAPGGVVAANNLNVPEKARKEFERGMDEMNANKLDSAKKHFEKAIDIYPNFDSAYNNIGVIELQNKNRDAAKQAFAKAVELNDKNPDATSNLAQLKITDDDLEGAKDLLKKSLMMQPQNPKSLMLLAFAQFKTKEFEAALSNAEKVHQGDIDHFPLAHLIAARIREGIGDRAAAERQYEMYLKEAPEGPEARIAQEGLTRIQAKK